MTTRQQRVLAYAALTTAATTLVTGCGEAEIIKFAALDGVRIESLVNQDMQSL